MGSRRSAKADASVIAVGVMALAAAAFAVYWLIIGAVWLVGVLVRLLMKQPKVRPVASVTTLRQLEVEPPESLDYEERTNIRPLASADDETIASGARTAFGAWASGLPRAPRDTAGLIRGIEIHRRLLVRRAATVPARPTGSHRTDRGD